MPETPMISSKKAKPGKASKPKSVRRQKGSNRQPDWDPTIHDLSGMRLSEREQARRHTAHMSKNRVQLPEGYQHQQEQQNSAQHSLPSGAAWQDNSQIDISAVVKDLQAGKAATGAQTDSKQPDSHGNNGSDCPDADDASEEACEDMDGNCNGAEATPQDAAQTSKDKPDDEAVFRGGSETQQNHRQRAQAAITSAPQHTGSSDPHASTKPDTSSATSRQSADKASTSAVSNSETSHTDLQQQKRQPSAFAAQFPPVSQESPDSSQLAASTSQSTMHDIADLSSTEQQLEAKLSALTDRLHAAEQAAGQHSELQQQLQELKQAKNALQADMKQFTEHISSMLTTLQSQVSRLLLPGFSQGSTAQQTADQSPANKGSSSQGSLSTTPLQWHLESHGAVPSPLARHRIFSSQTASSPRALADCGSTSAANVSMMRGGVASMSDQAASQPSTGQSAAAGAQEPGSSDDCIFDDEVGLPSFAQMATSSSVAQLPSTESYSQSARTQTAHPWLEQLGGSQSQASQLQTAQSRQAHFQSSEANDPAVGHPHQLQSVRLSNKASEPELQQQQSQRVAGMHQQPLMAQTPLQSLPLPSQRFWHMPAAQEPSHRWQRSAAGLPDFGLGYPNDPQPLPLPQRLVGLENRQPNRIQHSVSGPDGLERQTLKEVVVPQLRHRGLPHAPLAQSGYDQGSPGLRLKPMSVGQPPSMAVGTKHDSLALSVWASAQQSPQGRMI